MGWRLMDYRRERLHQVRNEIQPLLEAHWQEIALHQDKISLNPDWSRYESMDAAGSLAIYTARDEGKLVGYFVVMLTKSLHYSDHFFAHNDIIFVSKEYRKGTNAIRLIKFAEQDLERNGVSLIVINTKTQQPFDCLLEKMGYSLTERVYTKVMI